MSLSSAPKNSVAAPPSSSRCREWKVGEYRCSTVATMYRSSGKGRRGVGWAVPGGEPWPDPAGMRLTVACTRPFPKLRWLFVHPQQQLLQAPVGIVLLQQCQALLVADRQHFCHAPAHSGRVLEQAQVGIFVQASALWLQLL